MQTFIMWANEVLLRQGVNILAHPFRYFTRSGFPVPVELYNLPYGKGNIAWASVMSALRENSYSGFFNLEIPGERGCPLPVRLAKLDYIRCVVDFLMEMQGVNA
jgi:L-ribulose-5-phosphate 3-epimerase UlaE